MSTKPTRVATAARADRWSDVLAVGASFLTVVVLTGGLIVFQPMVQVALLGGCVAGLLARSSRRAAATAAIGTGLGGLVGPMNSWFFDYPLATRAWQSVVMLALGALMAWLISEAARRVTADVFVWLAVAVIVANLWGTVLWVNTQSAYEPVMKVDIPTFNQQLAGDIPAAFEGSDQIVFQKAYLAVHGGAAYYPAFRNAYEQQTGKPPRAVLNFRLPYLFYLWAALPGPSWIVYAFLLLASAAIACTVPFAATGVRAPLAIAAAGALAAYFRYFPVQLLLFSQEEWAVAFGIMAFTAAATAVASERWRLWTVAAVAAAVAATLCRETIVFVPLAGLVSAFILDRDRRRFSVVAWAVGLAALAAVYAAHFWATRPFVDAVVGNGNWTAGSFAYAVAAIRFATDHLGLGGWLAWALVVLGVLGAFRLPTRSLTVLALASTIPPLLSFLVLGNDALYSSDQTALNYWGATVVPLLYLCVPFAFAFLPEAVARPRRIGS